MNQKISLIITAFKEENTIAKCISSLADTKYSGVDKNFELILVAPDEGTHKVALEEVKRLGIEDKFIEIYDPGEKEGKGKPTALNMALKKATGEILVFTDGDVYFGQNAVSNLIKHFEKEEVVLVTGRPRSDDKRDNMMGYFGHLLSDAAHHKRTIDLTDNPVGKSLQIIKKRAFFPVSGYIYAMRKNDILFPEDCLVDDAFISYAVFNAGGRIEYEPEAEAFIKYATNLNDYYKQKKRSTGGFVQLWEYGVVKPETKTRSFGRELEYIWFPIRYSRNIREFFWSILLYPIRLWLWVMIYWERKIVKKDFVKTWVRIESTK
jgi:cellulose synthase/poly-beta-1,6-N-acetylglucosamine synthase-like glycosyltransferase